MRALQRPREMRDRAIYYTTILCVLVYITHIFIIIIINTVVITPFFFLLLLGTFGSKTDAIIHQTLPTHYG